MLNNSYNLHKTYLGDGVYASHEGSGIWLFANDHREELATDKIYLELKVLGSLNKFNEQVLEIKGE